VSLVLGCCPGARGLLAGFLAASSEQRPRISRERIAVKEIHRPSPGDSLAVVSEKSLEKAIHLGRRGLKPRAQREVRAVTLVHRPVARRQVEDGKSAAQIIAHGLSV